MERCHLSAAYYAGCVRRLLYRVGRGGEEREGEEQKGCNNLKSMLALFYLKNVL